MLNLKQGLNIVAVTLKEKGAQGSDFIVRLSDKSTTDIHSFNAVDSSIHPFRYNKLTFDVGSLVPGQYNYSIVGVDSPELLFESGIAVVEGQVNQFTDWTSPVEVKTWKG